MYREFQTAWQKLKPGGLLLSHNIDYNNAFADFCHDIKANGRILHETGGVARG